MTLQEAEKLIGKRAQWELKNLFAALTRVELLNTEEEKEQFEAVILLMKGNRYASR